MGSYLFKEANPFAKKLQSSYPQIICTSSAQDKGVVSSVVVTFHALQSYDKIFTQVKQKSRQGTKVAVYSCDAHYIQRLQILFENQGLAKNQTQKMLMKDIKSVHSDCVVFNWECSVGYGQEQFPQGKQNLFSFLKKIIEKGYMAMFSDHSLKVLIRQWNQQALGPNPFVLLTMQNFGNVNLKYDPQKLKTCPSSQLRLLGQFSNKGQVSIHTQSQTVVYTVDKTQIYGGLYDLQVLSIFQNGTHYMNYGQPAHWKKKKTDGLYQRNIICKLGDSQGTAGHTILKYKSGGKILTSMTHWIQLTKIEVQPQRYFRVAQQQYGRGYVTTTNASYQMMEPKAQRSFIQNQAINMIQNHVPCLETYQVSQVKYKK